jgi:hypothetical protein
MKGRKELAKSKLKFTLTIFFENLREFYKNGGLDMGINGLDIDV